MNRIPHPNPSPGGRRARLPPPFGRRACLPSSFGGRACLPSPFGRGVRRNVEQGPHLWGCDRGGVHQHAEIRRAAFRCGVASIRQSRWNLLRPPRAQGEGARSGAAESVCRVLLAILSVAASCAQAAAPPSAGSPEAVVSEFYAYLLEPKRDIGQETPAQNRWLTVSLRELLHATDRAAKSALKCPDAGPDQRPPATASSSMRGTRRLRAT